MGEVLSDFANGIDNSEVSKVSDKEKIKSFGNSTTTPINLSDEKQVKSIIYMLAESVASRMRERGYYAKGVSLWIKDTNLQSFDRQMLLPNITNVSEDIAKGCMALFKEHFHWHLDIRALGVRVTHLTDGVYQDDLFQTADDLQKKQSLEMAIEGLRGRYGYNVIRRGNILSYEELSPLNPHSEIHIIHPKGFFKGK